MTDHEPPESEHERWLQRAELALADYLDRRKQIGFLPKGMYEQISLERTVSAARDAIEADARDVEAARIRERNEEIVTRHVRAWFRKVS